MSEIYCILDLVKICVDGIAQSDVMQHYYDSEEQALEAAKKLANGTAKSYNQEANGHHYRVGIHEIGHPYQAWVEDEAGQRVEFFIVQVLTPSTGYGILKYLGAIAKASAEN